MKTYILVGRKVHEFWGALVDPDQANLTFLGDSTSLATDGEVFTFLQLTPAKPIKILIMLHEVSQVNIARDHFSLD